MVNEIEFLILDLVSWPYGSLIPKSSGSKVLKTYPRDPPTSNMESLQGEEENDEAHCFFSNSLLWIREEEA